MTRQSEMVDDRPIMVNGSTVARAIINHNRAEAMKAADAAASHVSSPDNIQICTFSDGSHSRHKHYGGVGMAYRRQWLPREWTTDTEDPNSGCEEDMVEQAWSYGYAVGSLVMEAIGVLESLCAANEEIKQHLAVLQKHASTVQVKITTDCQNIPEQIARTTKMVSENKAKLMQPVLFKRMKEMITTLQGHGIQVVVEIHWSPRNAVPQLLRADMLAGEAMRSGLGYCSENSWSEPKESVVMKQLMPMLSGAVIFTRSAPAAAPAADEAADEAVVPAAVPAAEKTAVLVADEAVRPPKMWRRGNKKGKRRAEEMGEGRPNKKAKKSHGLRTMPASWGLDPDSKVFIWNSKKGELEHKPVMSCPFIRKVEVSTMETGEQNVFVNDGMSGFSMAKPIETEQTTRPAGAV